MAADKIRLRVLVCNDDGPPGPKSDYILPMVRALEGRGWDTHVCIPAGHKSWTGKAMDPWEKVTVRMEKYSDGHPWWICEGGTPASAANIGIHHGGGPFDLVISGPNFGRNSSSCFVTSSGTVAAAFEGALAGLPAVALSFDTNLIETKGQAAEDRLVNEGCELAIDLILHLYRNWPHGVELFNINVPLAEGRSAPIVQTCVEKAVRYNSLYKPLQQKSSGIASDKNPVVAYEFTCSNVAWEKGGPSAMITDSLALNSGKVSVTPMLATFAVPDVSLDVLKNLSVISSCAENAPQYDVQSKGSRVQSNGHAVSFAAALAVVTIAVILTRRHQAK